MSVSKANDDGYDSMSATEIGPKSVEVELTGIDDLSGTVAEEAPPAKQLTAANGQTKEEEQEKLVIGGIDLLAVQRAVNDQLVMMMPPQTKADVHDLRKTGFAQLITIAFIAAYLIALIYNSVMGHRQIRKEAFLSPDLYAGECNEVPLAITSVYEADSTGTWDTQPGYVPTQSMYAMDLRGTKVTNDEYPEVMRKFQSALEAEAERSSSRDLSYSMLALASYNIKDEDSQMNFFTNARAEKVFGSTVYTSALTNKYGWCEGSSGTYNPDSGMISYKIDFTPGVDEPYDYSTHTPCNQVYKDDFRYDDIDANGIKTLQFDIRSIATAVSVNLGMTSLKKDLAIIRPPNGYFENDEFVPYDLSYYDFNRYVDPFYADMAPIVCFNGTKYGEEEFCLLEGDYNYYFPMITQYGNWWEEKMCTCGESGTISEPGMRSFCSESDFLVSLVYVPYESPPSPAPTAQPTFAYGITPPAPTDAPTESYYSEHGYYDIVSFGLSIARLRKGDPDGDLKIAKLFHPVQFRSVYYPYWWDAGILPDPFWDLCEGRCSVFTIEFFGSSTNPMNARGTPVYAMFNNTAMVACSNGLYREEAFEPLIETAPVTLVQAYYTCILNNTAAAQRAVGIAAGSAALYASVVLNVLLVVAIYGYNFLYPDKIVNPALKKKVIEDDIAQIKKEIAEMRKLMPTS